MFVQVTEPTSGLDTSPKLYFRHLSALLRFGSARQSKNQLLRTYIFVFSTQILSSSTESDPSALRNTKVELKHFMALPQ